MHRRHAGIALGALVCAVGTTGCTSPFMRRDRESAGPMQVKIETPWWDSRQVTAEQLLAQIDRTPEASVAVPHAAAYAPAQANVPATTPSAPVQRPVRRPAIPGQAAEMPPAQPAAIHVNAGSVEQVRLMGVAADGRGDAIAMLAGPDQLTHTVRVGATMTLSRSGHVTNWSIREINPGRVVATDGQQTVVIQ